MDRSLDEIIEDRPARTLRGGRRGGGQRPPQPRAPRREEYPRDGVRKYRNDKPANVDIDWVHDRFEGDRYDQGPRAPDLYDDYPRLGDRARQASGPKIRVDNISYNLLERDIHELFERIGPTASVELVYDRADRSTGTAFVIYENARHAHDAIREFDGQLADQQVIRLTLVPNGPARRAAPGTSLIDRMERPHRSLLDRMDKEFDFGDTPNQGRRQRSDSPRRSDVRGPAPENIDRYVPGRGSRSPIRRRGTPRNGGGRLPGRRPGDRADRRSRTDAEGHRLVAGRPRKTAEELDAEMVDYWGKSAETAKDNETQNGGTVEDDVDMVT